MTVKAVLFEEAKTGPAAEAPKQADGGK